MKSLEDLRREYKAKITQTIVSEHDPVMFAMLCGFNPEDYQSKALLDKNKRKVYLWGRRTGKTATASIEALWCAINNDNYTVLIISPSLDQSREMLYELKKWLNNYAIVKMGLLKIKVIRESASELWFDNGSRIMCRPSTSDSLRGYGADLVICLPYNERILTDVGWLPIGDIVEKNIGTTVLTHNHHINQMEWKRIMRRIRNPIGRHKIVRIKAGSRILRCTDNHPIATDDGYIPASAVEGRKVYTLENMWEDVCKGKFSDKQLLSRMSEVKTQNTLATTTYKEKVTNVEIEKIQSEYVYDVMVEDNHNFFAEGVLVHNCDESARVDDVVLESVVTPMLATTGGSIILISTPWVLHNAFYRACTNPQLWSVTGPVRSEQCSRVPHDFLEQEKMWMPDMYYRQEYMAEWAETLNQVFPNRDVMGAVWKIPHAHTGESTLVGVDIAKTVDFTVMIAVNADDGCIMGMDEIQRLPYPELIERIKNFTRMYNASRVLIDKTGIGNVVLDYMAREDRRVYGYTITAQSKIELINNLKLYVEKQKISIPPMDNSIMARKLIAQLLSYSYEELPGSKTLRMNAPSGLHDDYVISLGLCCWLLRESQTQGIRLIEGGDWL